MRFASFALLLAAIVACGGPSRPAASAPLATATAPVSTATATSAATATAATAPYLRIALTDVRTGESFTLGGFSGKTVIVEGMAVW